MTPTPPLAQRLRLPVAIGLTIGLARYAIEFTGRPEAMYFGVYFVMPIVLLVIGARGSWGAIRWLTMLGTMAAMCVLVWGIPNTLAYTTGQFLEWNHGRFHHAVDGDPERTRAAPVAATALGKIGLGVMQGALTSVAGTLWCTVMGTVLIWLPGRLRVRKAAAD